VLPELKTAVETIVKVVSWKKDKKREEQRHALRTLLSGMKPNQLMSTAGAYRTFQGQVESPLFADETEVENVLRSMGEDGVQFDMSSKHWHIVTDRQRVGRFARRW
jgi:hypothetical protein